MIITLGDEYIYIHMEGRHHQSIQSSIIPNMVLQSSIIPLGGSISTPGAAIFFLIQIYKLVLVLPLRPYPYLSLLYLSMS